jgi:diguanylate cyclase (GGDEF)-like protein
MATTRRRAHRSSARRTSPTRRLRTRTAEQRCEDYRRAFLLLLSEPYRDLDSTLARMLEASATTLDVGRVSLWTFDEEKDQIRCEHWYAHSSAQPLGKTLLHRSECPAYFNALCKQLVVAANDARTDPRTRELKDSYLDPLDVGALLDVPVRAFGRYLGVICHESLGGKRVWTQDDENFASGVASQVALAFERDHSRRANEKLIRRSLRDEETQLANRLRLEEALDGYFQNPARSGALACTAIDQYTYLSGSLGHARTQGLLQQFAARMQAAAPQDALVARIATNEFALLLRDVPARQVPTVVEHWQQAAKLPFTKGEQRLFLTLSTGFAPIDAAIDSGEKLIAETHMAMLAARQRGGDRVVAFTSAMRREMNDRVALEQDLRRGLDAGEFDLDFQPIIPLNANGKLSLEALLRWRHPRHGVLAPASFINLAIDAGIMMELGRRVLHFASESCARLRARPGLEDLQITVNMSAPEVLLPGTADAIRLELLRNSLPPEAITIEITETALIVDLDRAAVAIGEIRALGVKLSLDDFGTAYSSLSWLRRLPIDQVKIDRSYVSGIESEPRDLAIVKSVVELAKAFERDVVAEGVECAGQLAILKSLGVDHAQGFHFAKPMPLSKLDIRQLRAFTNSYPSAGAG